MAEFTPHEAPCKDIKQLPLMHPGKPVGRDDLLKEIYNQLRSGKAVLLHGADGIGKSALAATLAAAYTQQPGGVLWLDASDASLAALLVRIGRAYQLNDVTSSENPTAFVGSVTSALLKNKPFIVLENVTQAQGVSQFLEKCAAGLPLILISNAKLDGNWTAMEVPKLKDIDAVVLFKQKSGITDNSEDMDIYGIAKMLGYMPFALVVAARAKFALKQPANAYFKTLQQVAQAAGEHAALTVSYRTLNPALQGLVLMLGATFRGETSAELLAMVSGVPAETLNQSMTTLSQLYLAEKFERYGQPYYRLPATVYDFAQTALKGSNRLEPLQTKVLEALVAYVKKYSAAGAAGHAPLAQEMDNILAAARYAVEHGQRDLVNTLVMTLTQAANFVQARGYVYELLTLRNIGSGSTTPFPAYGPEVMAAPEDTLKGIADFDEEDDEFDDEFEDDDFDDGEDFIEDEDELDVIDEDEDEDEALSTAQPEIKFDLNAPLTSIDVDQLRIALNQAKQLRDLPRQMQILKAIGKVLVGQDKTTEAITTYNEILVMNENINDDEGRLETLDMLTALLVKTNNSQAAVMHATQGLQLAERLNDRETKTHLLLSLGEARQDLGETEAAVKCFSQALEITRQMDDRQNEAVALYRLGNAYLDNGETDQALHSLEQARELFKAQGRRNFEGRVLGSLGSAYSEMERWSEAIRYFKSALHIAREVADKKEEGLQLGNMGRAQVQANNLPDALLSYRQALHLAYESEERDDIVSSIVELVSLMLRSNRLLAICELLLQDAVALEPNDRDVNKLIEDIARRKAEVAAQGISQTPINGSARQYAANAYSLLEA